MRRSALLVLLAACKPDYDLNSTPDRGDPNDTDENTDPGTDTDIPPDACNDPEQPATVDVETNDECEVELSTGTFTPVIEWKWGNSTFCGPAAAGQTIDTNGTGSIDDDDLPHLFVYQANKVIALKGDGTGPAWISAGSNYGQDGGFAVGDVNVDGWPDVVTASYNQVCALNGQTGAQLWCNSSLAASLDPTGYSYPSIADMNGDGTVEVTAGNAILNGADGSLKGRGTLGKGAAPYGGTPSGSTYGAMSVPIDLDGDGRLELVTGNAAYKPNGDVLWSNGGLDGLVAVADFDGDGEGEIVKTSGIYVTGMETDGTEVWGPLTYSGNLGAPAADDLDGDGLPEIVFAAQNALVALKWGGTVHWTAPIADYSGAAGPTFFDFEMDGYPEVLYADETTIKFFSGLDGSVKFSSAEHSSYTILETPIVADIDNDDQVEIVLGHCTGNNLYGAVTVYGDADGSWPPGRKNWNQHAYSITNIEDDLSVPSPTTSNWPTYNSFRSGDVGRPPTEYWDLRAQILDVCEDECDEGVVYVAARMLNAGNIDVPAGTPISLRAGAGGDIVDTKQISADIPAGKSGEMVVFEADASVLSGSIPVVTADENKNGLGKLYECDETNNAETWTGKVCD
jgi:hypothetical protein